MFLGDEAVQSCGLSYVSAVQRGVLCQAQARAQTSEQLRQLPEPQKNRWEIFPVLQVEAVAKVVVFIPFAQSNLQTM